MGDLPRKFPKRRVSEDKARRKGSCWLVGTVVESDKKPLQLVSEPRPSQKCGRRGRRAPKRRGDCDSHIPLSRERAREGKLYNSTPPG